MGALTEALARHLGTALRTGIRVMAIATEGDGCYRIDGDDPTTGKPALQVRARSVVIATPATLASELVGSLDPELAQMFRSIEGAPVVSACMAFSPADFNHHSPKGYGMVRPHSDGSRLLGVCFVPLLLKEPRLPT